MFKTVYPAEFQMEPVDLVGFDLWQDWEGMVDASKACRGAFTEYRPIWREARAGDLRRAETTPIDWKSGLPKSAVDVWHKARRLGVGMGMVPSTKPIKLSDQERLAFGAWKARVLRVDPAAWFTFWNVTTGTRVQDAAEQWGVPPRYIIALMGVLCRWLEAELWQTTNSVGELVS